MTIRDFIFVLNVDGLSMWQESSLRFENTFRAISCHVVSVPDTLWVVDGQSSFHQVKHFLRFLFHNGQHAFLCIDCFLAIGGEQGMFPCQTWPLGGRDQVWPSAELAVDWTHRWSESWLSGNHGSWQTFRIDGLFRLVSVFITGYAWVNPRIKFVFVAARSH